MISDHILKLWSDPIYLVSALTTSCNVARWPTRKRQDFCSYSSLYDIDCPDCASRLRVDSRIKTCRRSQSTTSISIDETLVLPRTKFWKNTISCLVTALWKVFNNIVGWAVLDLNVALFDLVCNEKITDIDRSRPLAWDLPWIDDAKAVQQQVFHIALSSVQHIVSWRHFRTPQMVLFCRIDHQYEMD
jgi:hypothetical protein